MDGGVVTDVAEPVRNGPSRAAMRNQLRLALFQDAER